MSSENKMDSRKVQQAVERCKSKGLRCTKLMGLTIELLVRTGKPLTVSEIISSAEIADRYDQASVYRLMTRLEEKGIVRRLGLRERAASFVLRHLHEHDDYIVCTSCGVVERVEIDCPVAPLEGIIASASGFRNLEHELEFFGVCPRCPAA
ncbi:MAG: transcriptional repressor [Verrucomicrobiales bacterium]|nr:transcriptional repressor [Verrucomicrobiales bacterium]